MSPEPHPEHIAAVRARFTDPDEEKRLVAQFQEDPNQHGAYPALIFQAFREALLLRFPERFNAIDVVNLVAEARLALKDPTVNPYAAEIVIRQALGDQRVTQTELDEIDKRGAQIRILDYLATHDLDDDGRDALIQRAIANVRAGAPIV